VDDERVEKVQLSGRTDGDLIVLFDLPAGINASPADYVGRIVPVRVREALALSLHGELVE